MGIILSMVGIMTGAVCFAIAGVVFLFGIADELVTREEDGKPGPSRG